MFQRLLDQVDVPRWLSLVWSVEDLPFPPRHNIRLSVEIEQHVTLLVERHVRVSQANNLSQLATISRESQSFPIFSYQIADQTAMRSLQELADHLMKRTHGELLANAYRLYEFDPRIGWSFEGNELPRSPLFDPRGSFSRTGWYEADLRLNGHGVWSRCPFCDEAHFDPPIWAGGNLLWVHPACWRNVWS